MLDNGKVERKEGNITLTAKPEKIEDEYIGISIDLLEGDKGMPVVDVEVDTKNRKILINFWQGKEDPKPKEIVLDF